MTGMMDTEAPPEMQVPGMEAPPTTAPGTAPAAPPAPMA